MIQEALCIGAIAATMGFGLYGTLTHFREGRTIKPNGRPTQQGVVSVVGLGLFGLLAVLLLLLGSEVAPPHLTPTVQAGAGTPTSQEADILREREDINRQLYNLLQRLERRL
jgi:hypothetical protein